MKYSCVHSIYCKRAINIIEFSNILDQIKYNLIKKQTFRKLLFILYIEIEMLNEFHIANYDFVKKLMKLFIHKYEGIVPALLLNTLCQ